MDLISVIMSVYNESISILEKSINSILNQTYKNIEFIIINDNPLRIDLSDYLEMKCKFDSRIVYIKNSNNIGLVNSLNKAIEFSKGKYIARMDADDISVLTRLEIQLEYIKNNECDLIGSYIKKINEESVEIGEIIVPIKHKKIVALQKYGSCLFHPTWFGTKTIFTDLCGYRNIYACEDYDFIMRAIQKNYKLGNVPQYLLFYRIRKNGISVSSESRQRILMYYISEHKKQINKLTEEDFERFISSNEYKKIENKMNQFVKIKEVIKREKDCKALFKLVSNKYFYKILLSKIILRR